MSSTRTVKEILSDLSEPEQRVLEDLLKTERDRLALTVDTDVPDLIVRSLAENIK